MNRNQFEEKFLDYLENRLSHEEREAFDRILTTEVEAKRSFDAYCEVMQLEALFAKAQAPQAADFGNQVLRRIADETKRARANSSIFAEGWRLFMDTVFARKTIYGGVAGLAVLTLCLKLAVDTKPDIFGFYRDTASARSIPGPVMVQPLDSQGATHEESPRVPSSKPNNQVVLPVAPGNRAITIEADSTSAIEGSALPGTRVDVVETKKENGALVSRIISQNARVLSAEKDTASSQTAPTRSRSVESGTVTLDTSVSDALKILNAKETGKLSIISRDQDALYGTKGVVLQDPNNNDYSGAVADKLSSNETPKKPLGRISTGGKQFTVMADGTMVAEQELKKSNDESFAKAKGLAGAIDTRAYAPAPLPERSEDISRFYPGCCDVISQQPQENSRSYNSYEENQRIQTSQEPMSTFSIDVDTASYSQARRALQEGRLPQAESVRIEEFLNYFNYNYPVQTTQPFTMSYEIAPSPLEKEKFFLKLGIKAKDASSYEGGWNLVFLVDVSGSMASEDKLGLVKKALGILVEKMRPEDRVAIVTYAGSTGVALDSTSASEKTKIQAAIASLGAGGSTNGSGGIIQAYSIAEQHLRKNAVNRVILTTDGDFNVGVTSQADLIKLIEEKRKTGITLTTIGVGQDNLKDGTLEQLADKGNGNYFYLDSLKEARKVMEEDLTKNMEVVAKDVKLQIEFNPQHVKSYRLVGYDNRRLANKDFNNDKIDAGEIGAGHTVTAIYELILTGTEAANREDVEYRYKAVKPTEESAAVTDKSKLSPELAFLKIRYKDPEASESKLLQYPLATSQVQQSDETASADFKFAAAVTYLGTILRESTFKGDYSLTQVAELAKAGRGSDPDGNRQEFIELVKNAAVLKR